MNSPIRLRLNNVCVDIPSDFDQESRDGFVEHVSRHLRRQAEIQAEIYSAWSKQFCYIVQEIVDDGDILTAMNWIVFTGLPYLDDETTRQRWLDMDRPANFREVCEQYTFAKAEQMQQLFTAVMKASHE